MPLLLVGCGREFAGDDPGLFVYFTNQSAVPYVVTYDAEITDLNPPYPGATEGGTFTVPAMTALAQGPWISARAQDPNGSVTIWTVDCKTMLLRQDLDFHDYLVVIDAGGHAMINGYSADRSAEPPLLRPAATSCP